jgi:hypothetical protein
MPGFIRRCCIALFVVVALPSVGFGQGAIAGAVKDSSGAVLPGVTVEASSPALIEKTRAVVSDGSGQYRIEDLRPGAYTVTFALGGFGTIKREGIELTGSFTATVNAEMRVGAVEETLTVKGESPIVDVQNATRQQVMTAEVIAAIPTSRTPYSVGSLIPSVTYFAPGGPANSNSDGQRSSPDVGGTNAVSLAVLAVHGGRTADMRTNIEGLSTNNTEGAGQFAAWMPNMSSAQEVTFDLAGGSADRPTGGVSVNVIPREGGNRFNGTFFGNGTNGWQSSNYTDDLKARGLATPNNIDRIYDVNGGFGGPLVRDRLWFYTALRRQVQNIFAGGFENLNAGNPNAWVYAADVNSRTVNRATQIGGNGRATWQVNAKNKLAFYYDAQSRDLPRRNLTALNSSESTTGLVTPYSNLATVTWSAPLTSRLLVQVGGMHHTEKFYSPLHDLGMIGVTDQATGRDFRGQIGFFRTTPMRVENLNGTVSYITGAHAVKVGTQYQYQYNSNTNTSNDYNLQYRFNNGVPNQLTEFSAPTTTVTISPASLGAFAQDRWTTGRLTTSFGIRFDYWNTYFPEQHFGPSLYTPTRDFTFPRTSWASVQDLTPRLGAVYDLSGDGKTAVKVSLNKYVLANALPTGVLGGVGNPASTVVTSINRTWNDLTFPVGDPRRGNFVPDCDLTTPLANGECGVGSDLNFGKQASSTRVDPSIITGWGKQPYNWEFSAGVSHELRPGVSLDVDYFRRWYGNFYVTDNLAVSPTDFSPFSITAPVDSRLPGGGGYVLSGLVDLNPNKVGQVSNFITLSDNYGNQYERWQGIDVNVTARLLGGARFQGGVSTGRTVTDQCDIQRALPEIAPVNPYCHVQTDFLTVVKGLGTYTIPKIDLQTSATFQSLPGPQILANYVATNAVIAPSLGRNLSNGANATINLVAPGTVYGDRVNELDLRLGKVLAVGRTKSVVTLDVYNLLNVNPITEYNRAFANWQAPVSIWQARFVRIGVQFDF